MMPTQQPQQPQGMLDPESLKNLAPISKKLIEGGKKGRKRFYDSGLEIAQYAYSPNYKFEYTGLPANAFFRAKVALTAEAMRVFGPYLYQVNPHRTFTTRDTATPQMGRVAEICGQYLNYTPDKLDLYGNNRRALDDALSWGRGVLWTEVDPSTGLIGSFFDTVRNLIIDPEAKSKRDIRWVGRKYRVTRPEAQRIVPKGKWAQVKTDKSDGSSNDNLPWELKPSQTLEMVQFWRIWLKAGLSGLDGASELVKNAQKLNPGATLDQPMVITCSDDGRVISCDPWDVPFFKSGDWPCTWLDFYDSQESAWPVSVLEPAMGFQRAINWLVTLMMGKYRFTSRTVGAIMKQGGEGLSDADTDKILMGGDIEMMQITVKGEVKSLNQFISEFNWSHDYLNAGMSLLAAFESRFQKATGLYEILYAGETGTQSRSATDASVKDRNSQSRVKDMRDRVEKWQTDVARKEAMALRFLKDRDHITEVLGQQAGQDWGFLVKPGGGDVQQMAQGFVQNFEQQGMPPQMAIQKALEMAQQLAAQAVDMGRWSLETDYAIEADSIKRRDIDQRIDSLKELMNQLVPTQIQSPNPMVQALGYSTTASYLDAIGAEKTVVQQYRQLADGMRQMAMAPAPQNPGAPAPQPKPQG